MEPFKLKPPKIPNLTRIMMGERADEKRVRLRAETRKQVYVRAKKRCECCGMPLKISEGEFHHLRKPSINASPRTVQFLCGTHHNLGHVRKTRTKQTMLGSRREPYVRRIKVRKHPSSPYWSESKNPRKKRRKPRTNKR
jgi:hypothetical protein